MTNASMVASAQLSNATGEDVYEIQVNHPRTARRITIAYALGLVNAWAIKKAMQTATCPVYLKKVV